MIIVCITLVIALIPEALPLAFGVCIRAYSKLDVISDKKRIIFQAIKSIEAVGQVNCLCLEVDIDRNIDELCLSLCYIKNLRDVQLIVCSRRPFERV